MHLLSVLWPFVVVVKYKRDSKRHDPNGNDFPLLVCLFIDVKG